MIMTMLVEDRQSKTIKIGSIIAMSMCMMEINLVGYSNLEERKANMITWMFPSHFAIFEMIAILRLVFMSLINLSLNWGRVLFIAPESMRKQHAK